MKRKVLISLVVVIIGLVSTLFLIDFKEKKSIKFDKGMPYLALNNKNFDVNFLKLETKGENIVYSPLSIKYVLNMLREGADRNTLKEIDNLLGDNKINKYRNTAEKVSIANAIFIRSDFKGKIRDSYTNTLKSKYNAEIKYDDFIDKKNVNKWVEEKTFKLIKEMLTDEDIQGDKLRLVLINTLAINMEWVTPFNERTGSGTFYKSDGRKVKSTMMNMITNGKDHTYYIDDSVTILRKDLKAIDDANLEVVFIKPNSDIDKFIKDIDTKKLNELLSKTHTVNDKEVNLNITLPKFTYEYEISLKNDLQKLGINDLFNNKEVDLTKIYKENSDNAAVSDIKHKAKIEMSELGVKAGAATAAITYDSAGSLKSKNDIDLIFDKPFMYLIKNKTNEDVWFIGVVNEPIV